MADVEIEPHDPVWSERFETERDRIRDAAPDGLLGVFHIGSTAVPDLAAKPVLDVLAVFAGYDPARETAEALVADGYDLRRDESDWVRLNRDDGEYPVVVHFRPREADTWRDQVVFREFLREDPGARAEYERAKREAAAEHPDDVHAYTDAKEATILSLTDRAYEEGDAEWLPDFDWSG